MQSCAVIHSSTNKILYFKETLPLDAEDQRIALEEVLPCINSQNISNGFQKVLVSNGVWYLTSSKRSCSCLVLCNPNYPEQSAQRFLSSMERILQQLKIQNLEGEQQIEKLGGYKIYNLLKDYNNNPNYQGENNANIHQQQQSSSSEFILKNDKNSQQEGISQRLNLNQFLCYGFLLLIAFLMIILIVIKLS